MNSLKLVDALRCELGPFLLVAGAENRFDDAWKGVSGDGFAVGFLIQVVEGWRRFGFVRMANVMSRGRPPKRRRWSRFGNRRRWWWPPKGMSRACGRRLPPGITSMRGRRGCAGRLGGKLGGRAVPCRRGCPRRRGKRPVAVTDGCVTDYVSSGISNLSGDFRDAQANARGPTDAIAWFCKGCI